MVSPRVAGDDPPNGDPWAWLTEHHEGRLDYETGRGFRSVVVLYAIADGQILFRLPDYNDIVHYAPGERVTLEVDGAVTPSGDSHDGDRDRHRTVDGDRADRCRR